MISWTRDKVRPALKPPMLALSGLVCLALILMADHRGGVTVQADTLTGEVRGSVFDVDGNLPLADVALTLENVDRGWQKSTSTDAFGSFAFLQLEPGNYTVRAAVDTYYPQEKTGVLVRLNQPKVVLPPFQLRKEVATATATQQITLRGEQTRTAVVDLTSTGPTPLVLAYLSEPGTTSMLTLLDWAIRANYDSELLLSLPLRGVRSFDQLGLLSSGVFRVPFSSGQGPAVGAGVGTTGQFAVNGMRGRSNNFTVDGSDNNDEDIGVRRQGFVSLVPQSSESVQEFQIITAGFPAEFGRNSGSMVNAVSRSGGNKVHGDIYGLLSNDTLSSNGFFDQSFIDSTNLTESLNGGAIDGRDFSQQLWGAVLGGQWCGTASISSDRSSISAAPARRSVISWFLEKPKGDSILGPASFLSINWVPFWKNGRASGIPPWPVKESFPSIHYRITWPARFTATPIPRSSRMKGKGWSFRSRRTGISRTRTVFRAATTSQTMTPSFLSPAIRSILG